VTAPGVPVVGLYWTLAGPVEVGTGREWSLFDFRDRCEEAARAGFSGIGLWHADLEHVLVNRSLGEMKQILDDNGLACTELEFLCDRFVGPGDDRRRASDARRRLLLQAAAALGAHHIKVGNLFGTPCAIGQIADEFALLCADAARQAATKVVYEFMPFDSNVNDLDKAIAVVGGADADNGGIAIDTWHMGRTIAPLDTATILESVAKTGRLVLVDQATRHGSASAVIAAEVAEAGFGSLRAPIRQVTALDATIPYSKPMEDFVLPDEDKIITAVREVVGVAATGGRAGRAPG
jgi:hypothetical protein